MRILLCLALAAGSLSAEEWTLRRMFSRPFMWGAIPQRVTWSKDGRTLAFLWNAAGRRFLDLYAYRSDTGKLVRLTDLEDQKDPLNRGAAEKDERMKRYLIADEGVADFDLAPDGARAVFTNRGDLYVVKTGGAEPPFRLTHTKSGETQPQFAADGRRIAYARDGQVYVQDLATGALTQATDIEAETGAALGAFRWSPDGKHILYTVRLGGGRRLLLPNYSGRTVTVAPFPRTLPGDQPVEGRIYVTSAEGETAKQMDAGPWGARTYAFEMPRWSPDGKRILHAVIHPDLKKWQVLVLDPITGRASLVAEDKDDAWVQPPMVAWSPDSKEVVFTSERDGWAHLYTVPASGGVPRQITSGAWEVSNERGWGHDPQWAGGYIYYASTEDGTSQRQFYRIRPDGSGKERLSRAEGVHTGVVDEAGRYVALLSSDLKSPWDVFAGPLPEARDAGLRLTRLTTSAHAEFAKYPWPETRFVSFPSRVDRQTVAAKLLLPPGYRPEAKGKKWPAVFFIHGSGYASSVLRQWGSYQELRYAFNCYLANRGYVVMDMDYRGSSGYGRDWRTGVYLHMGGKDLEDVLGAVDYMAGLANIDMNRVGIWGSSYGGFMAGMAMFLSPETFRAGAAFSAVNDWENYNAFYTEQRLGKPSEHPEAYRRSSPIWFSSRLRHPLLIVHGIVDNNVLFQDAVQLTEKLIHEGKNFDEAYYPEESHLFVRDESLIDAFGRAAEFFDRNLK